MSKDSAEAWRLIGEREPWWGVLSAPEYLRANLTAEAKERFYEQGEAELNWVVTTLRANFSPFAPQVALDFGSGLGRLTFPMSKICDRVIGLDISPGMREESSVQAKARDISNVSFESDMPANIAVDWINSYIVFQHIVPQIGYGIVKRLLTTLRVGGHISIHLTFAHDQRDRAMLNRDLASWSFDGARVNVLALNEHEVGEQSMYDYDMNRILMIVVQSGIRQLLLKHTDHGGAHGFWIFGRKTG